MVEKLVFERSRLNSCVLEKVLISYACISFIKHYALRSFCIKLLYFSKFWFFQIFNRSNLLLNRLKLRLKIWFESTWLDHCSIDAGSIEYVFRSIEPIFWPIENRSKSFLKHEIFTCSSLFQKFWKNFSYSFRLIQIHYQFFVIFPQMFLKVFIV